jgi:hypothetical protein
VCIIAGQGLKAFHFVSVTQLIMLPVKGKGVAAMNVQTNGAIKKTGLQPWN